MLSRSVLCTGVLLVAACGRAEAGDGEPAGCRAAERSVELCWDQKAQLEEELAELRVENLNLAELVRINQAQIDRLDPDGTAARAAIPERPTKREVMDALHAVGPAVQQCGKGRKGVATVSMRFMGSTGKVVSARIPGGDFEGTAQARCITDAVLEARVPPFLKETFSVSYPFVID